MPMLTDADILCEPAADHPGWFTWSLRDASRFNTAIMGTVLIRKEGDKSRVRMFPERRHSNMFDGVHGGMIMSLVDIALFPTMYLLTEGDDKAAAFNSVTIESSVQFLAPAGVDQPLDAVGEILHQTRRMAFVRGTMEQEDRIVASWSGLVRKPSRK